MKELTIQCTHNKKKEQGVLMFNTIKHQQDIKWKWKWKWKWKKNKKKKKSNK